MFSEGLFVEGLPTWSLFLELLLGGAIVVLVGSQLTRNADRLSDVLNLGKAWIGILLLAGVTSLPEVVTGGTAVVLGQPDLALGNIFGSCMFNVAIIVILNGFLPAGSILRGVKQAHSLSSTLGIVLISLGVLSCVIMGKWAPLGIGTDIPMSAHVLEWTLCILIAITYVSAMRLTYRFERREKPLEHLAVVHEKQHSLTALVSLLLLLSAILIAATIWMTRTAEVLQDHPIELLGGRTLGATFVGAFFLSIATSLPEIVTSITAVRMGQLDLALGNIFGSNMFNIFVIPLLKIVSMLGGTPLLMHGEGFNPIPHVITGGFAILITGVAIAGLLYGTERKFFHLGFDSFLIGVIYVGGMVLLLLAP